MTNLSKVSHVWENLETYYEKYNSNYQPVTRREYLESISLIKNGSYNVNKIQSVLGSEIARYNDDDAIILDELKEKISKVSSYLLANQSKAIKNLDDFVKEALDSDITVVENKSVSFEDAQLLKPFSYTSLKEAVGMGALSSTVRKNEDGTITCINVNVMQEDYCHFSNKRDVSIFSVCKSASIIYPTTAFYDSVEEYVKAFPDECGQYDLTFVGDSFYTSHDGVIDFLGIIVKDTEIVAVGENVFRKAKVLVGEREHVMIFI